MATKITSKQTSIGIILLTILTIFIMFSFTGIRFFIGFIILYILPFYLILSAFDLDTLEKLFFSLFMSLGFLPMMVYYISKLIPSFRLSTLLSFILLLLIAAYLHRKKLFSTLRNSWCPKNLE